MWKMRLFSFTCKFISKIYVIKQNTFFIWTFQHENKIKFPTYTEECTKSEERFSEIFHLTKILLFFQKSEVPTIARMPKIRDFTTRLYF